MNMIFCCVSDSEHTHMDTCANANSPFPLLFYTLILFHTLYKRLFHRGRDVDGEVCQSWSGGKYKVYVREREREREEERERGMPNKIYSHFQQAKPKKTERESQKERE